MNKVLIVDASESDRRLMSGLLVKHGYEPIAVDTMEAAKDEVAKLPPGAVIVTEMKFARGTAQELINWLKTEGYKFPVIAIVDNLNKPDAIEVLRDHGAVNVVQRLAFKASHPMFIKYLEEHGLTEYEINYLCLYAIGLKGKDVGSYIQLRRHYNISSEIRSKLGIDEHETNIGIYIRKLLKRL